MSDNKPIAEWNRKKGLEKEEKSSAEGAPKQCVDEMNPTVFRKGPY